jgi:glycosyltransferase involved in cell wall biosynthesis
MRLSVVVPVYNAEAYLGECIECLLDQDLSAADYEIILVNDASKDRSREIAEKYAKQYGHIALFNLEENQGPGVARNMGIFQAKGTFLYFIDADDYIERKALGKIVAFMEKNNLELCGFAYARTPCRNLSNPPDWACLEEAPKILTGLQLLAECVIRKGGELPVWQHVFKKELLQQHGIFFEIEPRTYAEDVPFVVKVCIYAKRAIFLPMALYYYYINRNSVIMRTDHEARQRQKEGPIFIAKQMGLLIDLAQENGASVAEDRKSVV